MSDRDDLPARGIPAYSVVDENGVSTDGTSASMNTIRSRGMQPICEINASGVATSGSTMNELRSRGIRFYCAVTENAVTSGGVTLDALRSRGIPFFCPVDVDGIAVGGTATLRQLASRGLPYACLLDSLGGASGPPVVLPTAPALSMDPLWDTTQSTPLWVADAAWADQDDLQFEVQVSGGDWSAATVTNHTVITSEITGTIIDFPSGALSNGNYQARCKFKHSGGAYSAYSNIVSFTVAAASVPVNSVAPVISGNTQVGQTLSTTNGTWSNSPTGYAYQWKRDGSSIGSATASTYALVELDAGADVTCDVTASNGSGSGTAATSNTLGIDVYLVFLAHVEDAVDASTYNSGVWTSVSLGTAAANRKIVVAFTARGFTGGTISAATIAGQTLTSQIAATSDTLNNKAVIAVADVPTGTSGNISVTFTTSQSRAGAGIWAMYGAGSSTASDTDKTEGAADGNVTLTVPAKGVAVGVSYHQTAGTATWTGLTGRYDAVLEATIEHAGADLNSNAGGNINMISDWSAVDATGAHAFASWGP